ncbi:hypothetical protein [Streptococcus pseudopneumoniae]|uniref:hypothetical protein n=1 Tax=Streptococcus pseudopneumoniae TaxID=257758 RepID=UPI00066EF4A8|nr:hypothetical protein [Streptococcus pseudopneumoniae]
MQLECLQDESKLILMSPYKDTFNRVGGPSIISLSVMILWILKYLMAYNTDFSYKIVMAIVLIYAPLLIWFLGYSLFINGVKLEVYKNNIVQYYTYSNRGHSVLHYQFKLQDIEQLTIKRRPFNCVKITIKIKNPICVASHEKKINKLTSVSIITNKLKADAFMNEMKLFQSDKSGNQFIK